MFQPCDLRKTVADVPERIPRDFNGCGYFFFSFFLQVVRQLIRILTDVMPREIDERKFHQGIFSVFVVRIDFPSHGELTSVRLLEHRAGSSAKDKQNQKRSDHWVDGKKAHGSINPSSPPTFRHAGGGFRPSACVRSPRLRPTGFGLCRLLHSLWLRW